MERRLVLPLCAAVLLPFSASAAQVSTPLEIMATVSSTCTVTSAQVDFGVYNGPRANSTGEVVVTCNDGVPFSVGLDGGLNSDGANRRMADSGGNYLPYRLTYLGGEWGDDGITNSYRGAPVQSSGTGAPEAFTVDALIFANQEVPPGVYTDTVTVTVAF